MNKLIITAALIFGLLAACGPPKKTQLVGTWEKVDEVNELEIEPLIEFGDTTSEPLEVLLLFREDGTMKVKQGSQSTDVRYRLNDNELTLGNRQYELVKVDADSLVLKDITVLEALAFTHIYVRTNKRIGDK
ncbi:hypothetical protein [Carboxylicivirga taeanensis]|uniref:hypothetical protein n=1 Tax=Carboxylicivirga taeanensis TaxID=1416875 RepID=UPI003F6DE0E7